VEGLPSTPACSPAPGKEQHPHVQTRGRVRTRLSDIRLGVPNWKPGDQIVRGRDDTLEVVEVRDGDDRQVLVVRSWTA
jgi:hypothetical protein